ncbi:MAG: flagellar motor protein MotB [Phycisphaerales bacterium]
MADEHDNTHGEEHGGGHGGHGGGGHGHGGGGHAEGEHEGAPEWLISFADNVALMMGFFVILLAMNMQKPTAGGLGGVDKNPASEQPDNAMLDFVIAMRQAFHNPIDMNGSDPNEAKLRKRMQEQRGRSETNDPGPEGDNHRVQAQETSDYVQPTGIVTFDTDSAALSSIGARTAADVAAQLRGRRVFVEVRGHVSAAEAFKDGQRGMKLSQERAMAVAAALIENEMKWSQIRIVLCADSTPVQARADSPTEHRTNQRVEVVVTKEPLPKDQFVDTSSSAGASDH